MIEDKNDDYNTSIISINVDRLSAGEPWMARLFNQGVSLQHDIFSLLENYVLKTKYNKY